jgi:hypothetical protein
MYSEEMAQARARLKEAEESAECEMSMFGGLFD